MAEVQCPNREIATRLGISIDTLHDRYSDIIDKGRNEGKCKLRQIMYRSAMAGNTTMQIFLSKNMLGYSDRLQQEISGPDGKSILIENAKDQIQGRIDSIIKRQGSY